MSENEITVGKSKCPKCGNDFVPEENKTYSTAVGCFCWFLTLMGFMFGWIMVSMGANAPVMGHRGYNYTPLGAGLFVAFLVYLVIQTNFKPQKTVFRCPHCKTVFKLSEILIAASGSGDAGAQYKRFFHMISHPPFIGTPSAMRRNAIEATKWLQKAAEQGHQDAQWTLGICYFKKIDSTFEAFISDKGNRMYILDGINGSVPKDEAEAVKWFRKAAEQGHQDARLKLGECYLYGKGVTKDEVEATTWSKKVVEQEWKGSVKYEEACKYLKEIENRK